MAAPTTYERRIINRLAATDPQMSTALGTPIRKLIEAVAYELAQFDIDVATTNTLYSVNSVSGQELDYLVGQFGFTRQEARSARGEVTIRRDNADSAITIPYGTIFMKPSTSTSPAVNFQTTSFMSMDAGVTSATIPVICSVSGSIGNVAADSVSVAPSIGSYVRVTNQQAMLGGRDAESDETLRARFLETVFRNVSSTRDQYLGLAMSHADVTRGTIIGRVLRYSEVAQAQNESGSLVAELDIERYSLDVSEPFDVNHRVWVSSADGDVEIPRNQFDFLPPNESAAQPVLVPTVEFEPSQSTFTLSPMTSGNPYSIPVFAQSLVSVLVNGEPLDDNTMSCSWSTDGVSTEITITITNDDGTPFSADVTFLVFPFVVGDLVDVSFDYVPNHARDDARAVDIYVDGRRSELVTDIVYLDKSKVVGSGSYLASGWERPDGNSPTNGSIIVFLGYAPLTTDLGSINVGSGIVWESGVDYYPLYGATLSRKGSERSADAIEVLSNASGINDVPDGTPIAYRHYYNAAIHDVQSLIDQQSVLTCDPLVHEANRRIFEVNLTIMLSTYSVSSVEAQVAQAVTDWFESRPLGGVVQFSDIETVVANVQGVDNVRILTSSDSPSRYGIVEYARDGVTVIAVHTSDIALSEVDAPVSSSVNCIVKSQRTWG